LLGLLPGGGLRGGHGHRPRGELLALLRSAGRTARDEAAPLDAEIHQLDQALAGGAENFHRGGVRRPGARRWGAASSLEDTRESRGVQRRVPEGNRAPPPRDWPRTTTHVRRRAAPPGPSPAGGGPPPPAPRRAARRPR